MVPFSVEQFLDVFGRYNSGLPYVGIAASVAASLAAAAVFAKNSRIRIFPVILLVFLWSWAGVVYQIVYFAEINRAAYLFGSLLVLEAILLLYFGVIRGELKFEFRANISGFAGAAIIFYSIVIYPLLGFCLGQAYPRMPTFGVPCPVTIFTFGLLIWNRGPVRWPLLVIPVIWTVIGSTATFFFGIWEDTAMVAAAGAAIFFNHKKSGKKAGLNMGED